MCSQSDDPTTYDTPTPQPPRAYVLSGDAPAREPRVSGLDDAWNAATDALPDGWRVHLLEATAQNEWRAIAGVRVDDGTDPFIAIREGATPTDALNALADALRTKAAARL